MIDLYMCLCMLGSIFSVMAMPSQSILIDFNMCLCLIRGTFSVMVDALPEHVDRSFRRLLHFLGNMFSLTADALSEYFYAFSDVFVHPRRHL